MTLHLPRILLGLVFSLIIAWAAYRRRSLSGSGAFGAVLTGTLTFGFGGWAWGITLIAFFVTSSLLSHYQQQQKQTLAEEKFEKGGRRDLWQVLANGGIGALLALVYGLSGEPLWALALFAGVNATVNADTWATELGVLARRPPRLITTGRIVPAGTSGGVTLTGLLAAAGGALLIGIVLLLGLWLEQRQWLWFVVPAALLGGVAGALLDSLLGATLQAIYHGPAGETERAQGAAGEANTLERGWRWMNNDIVNLLSSLGGGLIALMIFR